jgi:hypothetical protein
MHLPLSPSQTDMREKSRSHFVRARGVGRAVGTVPDRVVHYGTMLQK